MPDFIWRAEDGTLWLGDYFPLTDDEEADLREFFRAEEDERLGRWRRGDHVVYPNLSTDERIHVLDEATGQSDEIRVDYLRGETTDDPSLHEIDRTALVYLLSKPEPKPAWHDAQEGEVWLITYNGHEYPAIFQAGQFRDSGGAWTADDITTARRIYPESQ